MRIAIITILTLSYLILGLPSFDGVTLACMHHFFHANAFHLAVNAFTIWYLFKRWKASELLLAYVIASLAFFAGTIPSIGFSNMIYATIGLRTPSLRSAWWKQENTIVFLTVTLVMFLFPNVSAATHVASFIGGTLVAILTRWTRRIINDSSRYTGNL